MKQLGFTQILWVIFLGTLSCQKHIEITSETNNICVTGGSSEVTETTAILSGSAHLTNDMTGSVQIGIIVSEDSVPVVENSERKNASGLNPDNSFSIVFDHLKHNSTYYYRAFVRRNDIYMYGDIKSFKTYPIQCTVTTHEASFVVSSKKMTLNGFYSLNTISTLGIKVGFVYSPDYSDLGHLIENGKRVTSDAIDNYSFSASISINELTESTYFYTAFAFVDGEYFWGDVLSFDAKNIQDGSFKERKDWSISYIGRINKIIDDKTKTVESFQITYNGLNYLLPLIIRPGDLDATYNNDIAKFFTHETEMLLLETKKTGKAFYNKECILTAGQSTCFFKLMLHGTWNAYLVELDREGKPTGDYALTSFTITEEIPAEAFTSWLGAWHVTDGHCSFVIYLSSAEANYLYYVDRWEQGTSVAQQMDGGRDWIYARFEGGHPVFYAQFITNEEYDGKTVEEVFAGTYLTQDSDANEYLDWIGVDNENPIAFPVEKDGKYVLEPIELSFDNGYKVTYHSMRYSRLWFDHEGNAKWAFYNTAGVPSFPMTMTYSPGARSMACPDAIRFNTKSLVHSYQLKTLY